MWWGGELATAHRGYTQAGDCWRFGRASVYVDAESGRLEQESGEEDGEDHVRVHVGEFDELVQQVARVRPELVRAQVTVARAVAVGGGREHVRELERGIELSKRPVARWWVLRAIAAHAPGPDAGVAALNAPHDAKRVGQEADALEPVPLARRDPPVVVIVVCESMVRAVGGALELACDEAKNEEDHQQTDGIRDGHCEGAIAAAEEGAKDDGNDQEEKSPLELRAQLEMFVPRVVWRVVAVAQVTALKHCTGGETRWHRALDAEPTREWARARWRSRLTVIGRSGWRAHIIARVRHLSASAATSAGKVLVGHLSAPVCRVERLEPRAPRLRRR